MSSSPSFAERHLGVINQDAQAMLTELGYTSLNELIQTIIPKDIKLTEDLILPTPLSEQEALCTLKNILHQNTIKKSLIGQGYNGTFMPNVICRNILENPSWYTAYTPYQPEIAQGRLEALINFQTMITSLTGMDVSNASLLDEATACAEAMTLCHGQKPKSATFFIADNCHPQIIDVVKTRAEPQNIKILTGDWATFKPESCEDLFGVLVSYPGTLGEINDYTDFFQRVHATKSLCCITADLMALLTLKEPACFDTDICVGTTQRFGIPMGYGGPSAGYMAVKDSLKRKMPGRLIGKSIDTNGHPGYRLALQTREQHIRREKATSNICTAQVLMAILSVMYAIYHGPTTLKRKATTLHKKAQALATSLTNNGFTLTTTHFFDTITVQTDDQTTHILHRANDLGYNLRLSGKDKLTLSLGEDISWKDLTTVLQAFHINTSENTLQKLAENSPQHLERTTPILTGKTFNSFHSETDMMRYIKELEQRDLALNTAMIPLGSCTMKLNSASEMMPLTWPELGGMHPFAPLEQAQGCQKMINQLETWLSIITGFDACSLQPLSGAHGEYSGLMTIHRYHQAHGQTQRNICLIPTSAHGTNPASGAMAGMKIVEINCDEHGNIDLLDLQEKAEKHKDNLACIMVTYPSTHGVYEQGIKQLCEIVHNNGGQVYMDGANMNAQVGLTSPGFIGADVCHLNLHKTFAMPHGGGGPGVGPICVAEHLRAYLPGNAQIDSGTGAVSGSYWGNTLLLPITWMYIAMMGSEGLKTATETAILEANYIAKKLNSYYPILYSGAQGLCAHECIINVKPLIQPAGLTVDDIAKRLMDYGFHAPTMSFPVHDTLMIEPTESEPKREVDRFIAAMIAIYREIQDITTGKADPTDNVLKNAPHTAETVSADEWTHPYTRSQAAYPVPSLRLHKFWPYTTRIDNVYGDRNLIVTCDPIEEATK